MFVRLALEDDADAIGELAQANVSETQPHPPFEDDIYRKTFLSYLTTADPTFFVVEHRREVIAFMMASIRGYRHARGHYTVPEVTYVRSDMRGTRAAVLLMQNLVAWSEKLGAIEIKGGNDNGFNSERTAKFFGLFGFERVGFAVRRRLTNVV